MFAAFTGVAVADESWLLTAEAPAAVPVTSQQRALFGLGGMPAIGVYRAAASWMLLGARLRGGALLDGDAPVDGVMDPDTGGLGSVTVSLRMRPLASPARRGTGPWLELAIGGAVTGADARPTVEAGFGWGVALGPVNLGPSVRYLYVRRADSALPATSAGVALVGIELSLFDSRSRPAPVVAEAPIRVRDRDRDGDGILDASDDCPDRPEDRDEFEDEDGCPDLDNDGDRIADVDDACPLRPEVMNGVEDEDGCPDEDPIVDMGERVKLDQRIHFDTARARVKRDERKILRQVVALWKQHPEWRQLIVTGHADDRGNEAYNLWLSQERADRVVAALIELGMPAGMLEAVGHGSKYPRSEGSSSGSLRRNRRVELIVVIGGGEAAERRVNSVRNSDTTGDGGDR